ncbi:probable transporter MCH1 [Coccomyxa sp. Obi]|nr:probable transporter MCH1 [Coccomyxa sp. Obi]
MLAVAAAGMGTGLVYLNNLGQMVSALHGHSSAAVYVSIFSVSSCGGRLLLGHVPERALHARGVPRPLFLIGVSLVTAAVAVLCAFASLGALYPAALLAGLAFGGHWSLAPALACDFFGLRHFASNYCLLQLAPALGGFALATELAGYLYDRTAAEQGHHHNCRGHQCFRPAFLICAILCLFAAAAATVLHLRMRSLYIAARRPLTV